MLTKNKIGNKSFRFVLLLMIFSVLLFVAYNLLQLLQRLEYHDITISSPKIDTKLSYIVDSNSSFSIQKVVKELNSFKSAQNKHVPYELGAGVYWVLIDAENNSKNLEELILHIDNTMLHELAVYVVDSKLLHKPEMASNILQDTAIRHKLFPSAAFQLNQNSTIQILVRLETLGPPNVPLLLYKKQNFAQKTQLIEVLYGAFIGIILLMAIYNLVLYFAIKDKVYLVYIGYLLSAFLVTSSVNGIGFIVFSFEIQQGLNHYSLLIHYYLVIFLLLFTLYFLRYDQGRSKLYKLGILSTWILVLASIFSQQLPNYQQAQLFFSIQPLFYAFSILLIFRRLTKDFSWARYYFISWIPFLFGAAVQPLMLLNLIDYSFYARNAFLLSVLVEISFMAFALAERVRRHEDDRYQELSYHPKTNIPRKIVVEQAVSRLIREEGSQFSVLVIKPEQIERVSLYVNEAMNIELFKRFYHKLTPLFTYNDAILPLGNKGEKICTLENNRLALVVDHKKNHQPLKVIIESIKQLLEEAYQLDSLKLPLTAVVGVANYPEHGEEAYILLNRAQLAIQYAEHTHNKWAYYESETSDITGYKLKLAADMKDDLERGKFELFHQPQIDLKTMRVCGSECLIRWFHDDEGFIPPDVFIPIAEDMGIINRLTQWVIKKAIEQHLEIIDNGYRHHMVSINISAKDIASDEFYDFVITTLEESGLATNKIALELTESATVTNNKIALAVIEQLNALGITISIDDFGTGYSSMAYISEFPCQELKIDRQFVENVCDDKKRKVIAETTVKMAKGLGLEVVAEGVNSQKDEDTLRSFGCDIGQGYFYAKPMKLSEYLYWLSEEVNGRPPEPLSGQFIPKD